MPVEQEEKALNDASALDTTIISAYFTEKYSQVFSWKENVASGNSCVD